MRNGTASAARVLDCGDPDCDACHFARTQGVEHTSRQCINLGNRVGPSRVQAPARVHSGLVAPALVKAAEPLTVTLDLADALGVGLSLQMMIQTGRIPAIAAAPYVRVAEQLVAAARAAAKGVGQ